MEKISREGVDKEGPAVYSVIQESAGLARGHSTALTRRRRQSSGTDQEPPWQAPRLSTRPEPPKQSLATPHGRTGRSSELP
jgi:hypothetical protein